MNTLVAASALIVLNAQVAQNNRITKNGFFKVV